MKTLIDFINETFIKESNEEILDTRKNNSGILSHKQKEFVNNFIIVYTNNGDTKQTLYTGVKTTFADLEYACDRDLYKADYGDFDDYYETLTSELNMALELYEDDKYMFNDIFPNYKKVFRNMSKAKVYELIDIIEKSWKLLAAIFSNYVKAGRPYDYDYVKYDPTSGSYEDLDIRF